MAGGERDLLAILCRHVTPAMTYITMEHQLVLWTMAVEKLEDLINIHGDAKIRLIVSPSFVNQFLFF